MTGELWELSATELVEGYRARRFSPLEAVETAAARIEALDQDIGAFTHLRVERAREEARELTDELAHGRSRGSLHGVPVGVKELIEVAGLSAAYGSTLFAGRRAERDAAAVERLRGAGAVVLGLTRSHELGWGITTQNRRLGGTRNPWNLDRVPGGSSGGSAAALAVGMVALALGTDTGGSIRIPAAYCGVVGLKPTFGRVSRRGVVPLAPSLDHVGPLARSVDDLTLALQVLAGPDEADADTLRDDLLPARRGAGLAGVTIAVAPDLHLTALEDSYEAALDATVAALTEAGARIVELRVPEAAEIRPAFTSIQMAEAYHVHHSVLGTFPERAADYGEDVARRLDAASRITIAEYLDARAVAARVRHRFDAVLDGVDALLTPVAAGGPSTVSRPDRATLRGNPIPFRDLVMDHTVPQDLTGLPACAIRAGVDADGCPIGLQLTAARGQELSLLRLAAAAESAMGTSASAWPPPAALSHT